jgi:hypothetical protein
MIHSAAFTMCVQVTSICRTRSSLLSANLRARRSKSLRLNALLFRRRVQGSI